MGLSQTLKPQQTAIAGLNQFITFDYERFFKDYQMEIATIYPSSKKTNVLIRIKNGDNENKLFVLSIDDYKTDTFDTRLFYFIGKPITIDNIIKLNSPQIAFGTRLSMHCSGLIFKTNDEEFVFGKQ